MLRPQPPPVDAAPRVGIAGIDGYDEFWDAQSGGQSTNNINYFAFEGVTHRFY